MTSNPAPASHSRATAPDRSGTTPAAHPSLAVNTAAGMRPPAAPSGLAATAAFGAASAGVPPPGDSFDDPFTAGARGGLRQNSPLPSFPP